MTTFKWFIIGVGFLGGGCATVANTSAVLSTTPSCCKSLADFKYEQLALDKAVQLTLSDKSPAYEFPSGKSYFKAYSLPVEKKQTTLRVRSWATGSVAFETEKLSQLYCPEVTFLDKHYKAVFSNDLIPSPAQGALATGWRPSFIAEFEVPPEATYVLLHSKPGGYGRLATRYTGGGAYAVGSTYVVERGGEPIYHPCGPTADAEVSVVPKTNSQ
ncbi:MAG: hypothetical protein VW548_04600 [Methylotenera sp.]